MGFTEAQVRPTSPGMSPPEPRQFRAQLVSSRPLSPTVRSLVLRAELDQPLAWAAGQYVELELEPGVRKPYSIASAMSARGPGEFEVAVSHEGEIETPWLTAWGPAGSMRRVPEEPAVFIAAGTGLSPFRAMIQDELVRTADVPLLLLFGARSERDLLWRDELDALAASHARFRFEPTLSQPGAAWAARRGRVQAHFDKLVQPLVLVGAHVYVCGKNEMVEDCVKRLQAEHDVLPERLVIEAY